MANKQLSIELQLRADIDQAQKALKTVSARVGELEQSVADAAPSFKGIGASVDQATVGLVAFNQGIDAAETLLGQMRGVIDIADQYRSLEARIAQTTETQEDATRVMDELVAISLRTHAPLETTAELYARLALNTKEAGYSQQEMLGFTEAINASLRVNGTSTAEASGAMLQLSQAMASGVLRGEEFNSVNEQMPAVIDAIAKELGIARGAVKQWAEDGQISSDVVLKAVLSMGDTWKAQAESLPVTLAKSISDMETAWSQFLGQSETVTGASEALASAIGVVAENLDSIASVAAVGGLASVSAGAVKVAQSMRGYATSLLEARTAAQQRSEAERTMAAETVLASEATANAAALSARLAAQEAQTAQARLVAAKQVESAALEQLAATKELAIYGEQRAAAERQVATAIQARVVAEQNANTTSQIAIGRQIAAGDAAGAYAAQQAKAASKTGLLSTAMGGMGKAAGLLKDPIAALNAGFSVMIGYEIGTWLREAGLDMLATADDAGTLNKALELLGTNAGEAFDLLATEAEKAERSIAERATQASASLKKIADATGVNVDSMEAFNEAVDKGALVFDEATGSWQKGSVALEDLDNALTKTDAQLQAQGKTLIEASANIEAYNKIVKARNDLAIANAEAMGDEQAALSALAQSRKDDATAAQQALDMAKAQLANVEQRLDALKQEAAARGENAGAILNTVAALQNEVDAKQRAVELSEVAVDRSKLEAAQARITAETYGDQSAEIEKLAKEQANLQATQAKLTAAMEAAQKARTALAGAEKIARESAEAYTAAMIAGADNTAALGDEATRAQSHVDALAKTIELGTAAGREMAQISSDLAVATAKYADALQDAIEKQKNGLTEQKRGMDLLEQEADLRQTQLTRLRDEADARGDTTAAMAIEVQMLQAQIDVLEQIAVAKDAEAQSVAALIPLLEKQAEIDGLVTEAERAGIAAAEDAAEAKRIEAQAAEEAVKAKENELSAAREANAAAKEGADAKKTETDQAREGVVVAGQATAAYGALSEGAQRYLAELKKGADADYFSQIVSPAQFARVEEAYQEASQHIAGLIEKLKSGAATSIDLAEATRLADDNLLSLADQDLAPLRAAITDAASRMDQLQESAQSTLTGLRDELALMEGDLVGIEERDYARRKADLEAQIVAAQEAGDIKALNALRESLKLLEEIHDRKMADIKAETKARETEGAAAKKAIEDASSGGLAREQEETRIHGLRMRNLAEFSDRLSQLASGPIRIQIEGEVIGRDTEDLLSELEDAGAVA